MFVMWVHVECVQSIPDTMNEVLNARPQASLVPETSGKAGNKGISVSGISIYPVRVAANLKAMTKLGQNMGPSLFF